MCGGDNMKYYNTIRDLVEFTCDKFSEREAFIFKDGTEYKRKLFRDFKKDCFGAAKSLILHGITGSHVSLLGKTSYESLTVLFGMIIASNTAVVPDCNYPIETINDLLKRTDVNTLIYEDEFAEKAEEIMHTSREVQKIISISELLGDTDAEAEGMELPKQEPKRGAIILFTSGTTGKSKAVVLSNENICTNACATADSYGADAVAKSSGMTSIAIQPIHHAMFLGFVMTHMLQAIAIYFSTDVTLLLDDMKIIKPCSITVFPALVEQIYREIMKKSQKTPDIPIKKIVQEVTGGRLFGMTCGSAKLNQKYIKAFWDWGIVVKEAYGMTEAAPSIAINTFNEFKLGSVGKPLPGVEVKIVDGEIWCRSKCVMNGYYKDQESTKETIQDGWLRTGDLGYLDEDGFLFITGRLKNLIILSNGENVSPEELENLIIDQDIVSEAMVYEKKGTICAEIYNTDWENYDNGQLWEKVNAAIQEVNRQLPSYKKIQTFQIRKVPFPRNHMKKLLRTDLRQSEYIEPPKTVSHVPETKMEQVLAAILESEIDVEHINNTDNLFEIGANSLIVRRIVTDIQTEMNITIDVGDVYENPTVHELAVRLEALDITGRYKNMPEAVSIEAEKPISKELSLEDEEGLLENKDMKSESSPVKLLDDKESFPSFYPDSSVVLPMKYPVLTTFTFHAHLLSILSTEDAAYEWILSNYIQMFSNKDIARYYYSDFYFPMPNHIRPAECCPWITRQRISNKMISYMNMDILEFVFQAIDHHNYVNITLDYYYIKPSIFYHYETFCHDALIYGYDKKKRVFYCTDFMFDYSQKYTSCEVSFDDFLEAYNKCSEDDKSNYLKGQMLLFKLKKPEEVEFKFNVDNVLNSISNYYNSKVPEYWDMYHENEEAPMVFGMNVYSALIRYVGEAIASKLDHMDHREFYMMYDHKNLMHLRLSYLEKHDPMRKKCYAELNDRYKEIQKCANAVVFLILSYNFKNDPSILGKVIGQIENMRELEREALGEFFRKIDLI